MRIVARKIFGRWRRRSDENRQQADPNTTATAQSINNSAPQQSPISRLSDDLLDAIVSQFCCRRFDLHSRRPLVREYCKCHADPYSTLRDLCLLNKRIYLITVPHLYEAPTLDKWWLLARTLLARPDLAEHVRCFRKCYQLKSAALGIEASIESGTFPREVGEYYLKNRFGDASSEKVLPDFTDPVSRSEWFYSVGSDILLSLCPKVKAVAAFVANYGAIFSCCRPGSLHNLGFLEVICFSKLRRGQPALDPIFIRLSSVAPSLNQLRISTCVSDFDQPDWTRPESHLFPSLPFTQLHTLSLQCVTPLQIPLLVLLRSCPQLKVFSFSSPEECGMLPSGYVDFSHRTLGQMLVQYTPWLEELSLQLGSVTYADSNPEEQRITSLAALTNLQKLEIDIHSLVTTSPGLSDSLLLVKLLPRSIRVLTIDACFPTHVRISQIEDALQVLASSAPHTFQQLEEVHLEGLRTEELGYLESAFKKSGIRLHTIGTSRQ